MASTTRAIPATARLASQMVAFNSRIATRSLSTAARPMGLRPLARPVASMKLPNSGRIAFRRTYADEAPKPRPGKLRRTLRWVWRISYLSVGGVLAYTGYIIYQDRNPEPQFEADPNKKTLVILGKHMSRPATGHAGVAGRRC